MINLASSVALNVSQLAIIEEWIKFVSFFLVWMIEWQTAKTKVDHSSFFLNWMANHAEFNNKSEFNLGSNPIF